MFKYRAISFPILIALLAVMIVWPSWGMYLYAAVAGLAFGMMLYEAGKMLQKIEIPSYVKMTAFLGGTLLTSYLLLRSFVYHLSKTGVFIFALLMLACFLTLIYHGWIRLLGSKDKRTVLKKMFPSAGILLACGVPVIGLALVYFEQSLGPLALFYVMMVTKSMDTGGYIFGMLSGKFLPGGNHKIVPSISPKKSWEGTVGGILFSVGTALLFYWFFQSVKNGAVPLTQMWPRHFVPFAMIQASLTWHLVAGIVLALGSFAGDLTESALKRTCGIKDSGHWIPGMGGAFDVLDSFLYNGILFWVLVVFIR